MKFFVHTICYFSTVCSPCPYFVNFKSHIRKNSALAGLVASSLFLCNFLFASGSDLGNSKQTFFFLLYYNMLFIFTGTNKARLFSLLDLSGNTFYSLLKYIKSSVFKLTVNKCSARDEPEPGATTGHWPASSSCKPSDPSLLFLAKMESST